MGAVVDGGDRCMEAEGGCVADCEILRGGRGGESEGGSLASVVRLGVGAVIGQSFHEKLHEMKSRQPEPRGRTRDANIAKTKDMEITDDEQLHGENR